MLDEDHENKVAVVLFNLGGPDNIQAVKPFLFNLFFDKYIIRLPAFLRYFVAWIISTIRRNKSEKLYENIGGKSPILYETELQRKALELSLNKNYSGLDYTVFIVMRHWKPYAREAIEGINKLDVQKIVLLPLYPQFSTTTTASAMEDFTTNWQLYGKGKAEIKTICCYPTLGNFIDSHVEMLKQHITRLQNSDNFRVLFSAHNLPQNIIDQGDPYQWQVQKTVEKIMNNFSPEMDYKITYQSRVGFAAWLKPDTKDEIKVAVKEQKKALIIVPITFVSEHVETLVELDIEYANIASHYGLEYSRVPTLGVDNKFIDGLSTVVWGVLDEDRDVISSCNGTRLCDINLKSCPCKNIEYVNG